MFGIIEDAWNAVVDFVTGGGSPDEPSTPDPCDVGTCLDARSARRAAAGGARSACIHLKFHFNLLRGMITAVTLPWQSYVVILIIAFIFGGPLGVFIAFLIYLFLLLLIRAWSPIVAGAVELVAAAAQAEIDAIARVREECPEECWEDMAPTGCDLGQDPGSLNTPPFPNLTGWSRWFPGGQR